MTTKKNLVKLALMSTLTAGTTFAFTACSDDIQMEDLQQMAEMENSGLTRSTQEGFNVNEFPITDANGVPSDAYTAENWRNHVGIYVNDGGYKEITVNGKTLKGFSNISLPNSKQASACAHIPSDVWGEVWANGSDWELAFNLCGISNMENCNYLGFYNKYTGILRVFTYIPDCAKTDANDHMWVMQMHDALSSHAVFRYGLPMDRKINKKEIDQPDEMAQTVSPWAAYNPGKGLEGQALQTGWWAFDLDLSVYRNPGEQNKISDFFGTDQTLLSLSPKCGLKQFVDLTNLLKASATGSMELKKVSANTENGIFAGVEGLLDKANSVKNLYDLGTKMMSPNPLDAISAGLDLAKNGCDLLGIDYGKETTGFDGYKGDINLDLTGTIDTKGTITANSSVTGVSTPSIKADAFKVSSSNCSTLGEGIWNIKSAPKMYIVNDLSVDWRRQDMDSRDSYNLNNLAYPENYKSPFNGAANVHAEAGIADTKPFHGKICFFDPSSVEVELNPNIFPEGTTYKVSAVCGVRNGMTFGSTDKYRKAQGLKGSLLNNFKYGQAISDRPITEAPFDALSNYADKTGKTGVTFGVDTVNNRQMGVFGRGDSDFLIEPMALAGGKDKGDWHFYMLPAYEVTVTVTVEHNGRTFMYSRTYLPEYEECNAENLKNVYDKAKKADKTHFTGLFDSQVEHIQSIRAWIARTPISHNSIMTAYDWDWLKKDPDRWDDEKFCGFALIDGNPSTYWYSREGSRNYESKYIHGLYDNKSYVGDHTVSWVEFSTYFKNIPKSFTITCGPHTGRIPKNIRILGNNKKYDDRNWRYSQWEELYFGRINDKLAPKNGATLTLDLQKTGAYRCFRIECSGNPIDYSLAEFKFNY